MLSRPEPEKEDILERLRHPERERERGHRRTDRNLFVRNILNSVFILLAIVAVVGILADKERPMPWYAVGLVAVLIKMVEVVLRMPHLRK